MYKKNRFKSRVIIFVVIFVCLALSSLFINKNLNLPDFFVRDFILSIDGFFSRPFISDSSINCDEDTDKIKYYETENAELVSELNKLKDTLKIKKLLSDKELINASVSSRGFDYWNEKLIIDKGSDDGITDMMAVVSNGGLVGITDDVGHSNSSVLLLSNSKFPLNISVKVKIDDKEYYGILNNYNDGVFEVMGIVENVDIPSGSSVVTTGLGNIFPSGILVGTVLSVKTDNFDLSKIVNVKPAGSFDDISYVTVVKREEK